MKSNKENTSQQKYCLSEFQFLKDKGIYISQSQAAHTIDYSDGINAENYILKVIKDAKDISDDSDELMRAVKDWPSLYHLGIGRSNILKALKLPTDARVLELGSGCGALTKYLGENFKNVDGIEGSLKRSIIASARCRDLESVKIFCSDFNYVKFKPEYDIITLIGVLEYAPIYFQEANTAFESCLKLLKLAKSALKRNGILVIAIENKLGVKYFSGHPEEHKGEVFYGIHGYPNIHGPVTYSKRELEVLLKTAGFSNNYFYFCFPDYKFTSTIISSTESSQNFYLHNWVKTPFSSYNTPMNYSFHEGLAIKTLSQSGLLREFANSFLVIATHNDTNVIIQPDWIAKRFSTNRRKDFRCVTKLMKEPKIHIEKQRINDCYKNDIVSNHNLKVLHKVSYSPWYEGDLMVFDVCRALYKTDFKTRFLELLSIYYQELIRRFNTGNYDNEGYPLLKGDAIDFIFRNIIKIENKLIYIDNEWEIKSPIPADYIMYRNIVTDIIQVQKPWIVKRVRNVDKFIIGLMKHFFRNYGVSRHNRNKLLERSFQNLVTGDLFPTLSTDNIQIIKKMSIWKLISKMWNALPEYMKVKIKRIIG